MNSSCLSRWASFKFAFAEIRRLFEEHNFRIYVLIAALTVTAGLLCDLFLVEWCVLTVCFGLVMAAEGINTAVEILADRVCSTDDERILLAKDVAAGAVLLAVIAAVVVGGLIFSGKFAIIFH